MRKLLIIIICFQDKEGSDVKRCVQTLVQSMLNVNYRPNVMILKNTSEPIFNEAISFIDEIVVDIKSTLAGGGFSFACKRIRPSILGRVNVAGYEKVVLLDADSLFIKFPNWNRLDPTKIYTSFAATSLPGSDRKILASPAIGNHSGLKTRRVDILLLNILKYRYHLLSFRGITRP
jgi:hypothetical protein